MVIDVEITELAITNNIMEKMFCSIKKLRLKWLQIIISSKLKLNVKLIIGGLNKSRLKIMKSLKGLDFRKIDN